jgi:hypothetical protein
MIESFTTEQAWWFDTLQRGELPWGASETNTCPKRLLFRRYVQHAQIQGAKRRSIEVKIGNFLTRHVGSGLKTLRKDYKVVRRLRGNTTENGWTYTFPPLKECRERFTKEMAHAVRWNAADAEWSHEPEPDDDDGPF